MKKKIIIIGANEFQNRLVIKAKEMGIETHVFAWEKGAVAKKNADFFYPISIIEKEKILEQAKIIKPNGICTIATDLAMLTVNFIAEKLNLIGNSLESTKMTTNKYEMRKVFKLFNLPSPNFQILEKKNKLDKNLEYPVIVKPTDRSGSRGVIKVNLEKELNSAIEESLKESFEKKIIIEEFIDGKEYSVEMISQNGEHQFLQLTEKFTTNEPNFIEKSHLAPARNISKTKEKEIIVVIKKALNILGIVNGASHSEIKITSKDEIKIIEIGGRMGGDFIGSDMVKISKGIDFNELVIKVALGEKISNFENINYKKNALVNFIFDDLDIKKFNRINNDFSSRILEKNIKFISNKVTDSSLRNGYYIMEINSNEELKKIFKILEEQ